MSGMGQCAGLAGDIGDSLGTPMTPEASDRWNGACLAAFALWSAESKLARCPRDVSEFRSMSQSFEPRAVAAPSPRKSTWLRWITAVAGVLRHSPGRCRMSR